MSSDSWGIAFNEDNSHFFATRAGQNLGVNEIEGFIDQYAQTSVRDIFLNPNGMRTSYDSRAWEPIWTGYLPDAGDDQPLFASLPEPRRKKEREWVHTAWDLYSRGLDVYRIWIDRCRRDGMTSWMSIRMSDVHSAEDENNYQHSSFWKNNPHFRRMTYRFAGGHNRALDYGRPEVRHYVLSLISEICDRYDMDGIELDWMRSCRNLKPGWEMEGQSLLNEFMGEVRALVDKKSARCGRRIKLAVRVPSKPQVSWDLGLDVPTWIRMDWIDMLTVSPNYGTLDADMPIELWRSIMGGKNITLAACLEVNLPFGCYCTKTSTHTLETLRGAAMSYWSRGIDRLYLFNYMDRMERWDLGVEFMANYIRDYRQILNELGCPDRMRDKNRRHVLTFNSTAAVGDPIAFPLPKTCPPNSQNNAGIFKLHIGPKPIGGAASIVIGCGSPEQAVSEALTVWLNGKFCRPAQEASILPQPGPDHFAVFNADMSTLKSGYNIVEVLAGPIEIVIVWVEIQWKPDISVNDSKKGGN